MIDTAFHITPLVTAVGYEEVEDTSSVLLDQISEIIGITIFHLSLLNQTGIAVPNHHLRRGEK